MIRLLADENFDGRVLAGVRARIPVVDIIRVQDTECYQAIDAVVLEWAAAEDRVLLTHDVRTLINDAYARVRQGLVMPGVIEVHSDTPIGLVIEELEVLIVAGLYSDFADQIRYIPMR